MGAISKFSYQKNNKRVTLNRCINKHLTNYHNSLNTNGGTYMKRIITISFIALLAISFTGFAQDFSNSNKEVQQFGQIQYAPTDATTITHSLDPITVTALMSVACTNGGITSDNQYWRSFILADFGITEDFAVTMVEVGIETATGPIGGVQPMTVNLYTADTPWPTLSLTLIGTADVMVPDQALTLFQIPVTGTAPAGSELVVEISIPADVGDGNQFYLGANNVGQTADSWLSSDGCGIPGPPVGLPVTTASIGFPDAQWVMSVTGDVGGGGGGTFPEILYYTFDEAGSNLTENFADPGSGFAFAELFGAMSMGSAGQFGSALIGTGASSSTDYVTTGWIMDIGTGDWTISAWLDIFDESTLHYIFGETDVSFRCFYGGVAPTGGVVLRGGGLTDVPVSGLIPGPAVVHFVYDSSVPEVRTYVNGVFQSSVGQTGVDLTSTSDIFKVGSRGTSTGLAAGELFDEFRFYNRALDDVEIADTWNISIVPVELTSFTASVNDNDVTLSWETATELNNSGFEIEKKSVSGVYDKIGFVPGFGTTTEPRAYSFSDVNLLSGNYTYRLKQIDYDGSFEYSDAVEVEIVIPDVYSLHQNYPNPFNPSTKITFTLAANAQVTLKVFDVLGQEVMTLINQDITAGVHTYDFDAAGINSGVYFYRIEANGIDGTNFTSVKKMILLK